MSTDIIPIADLPSAAPGPFDSVVGVDQASGNPRRFPVGAIWGRYLYKMQTISSSNGAAVIDLSSGAEIFLLTLTENTTISFTGLPPAGVGADVRVRIKQHASAAKTCTFSGASVKTARGAAWSVSTVLSSVEDVGVAIDSAGNLTLYPSGLLT
jgi:hypothetical protein